MRLIKADTFFHHYFLTLNTKKFFFDFLYYQTEIDAFGFAEATKKVYEACSEGGRSSQCNPKKREASSSLAVEFWPWKPEIFITQSVLELPLRLAIPFPTSKIQSSSKSP